MGDGREKRGKGKRGEVCISFFPFISSSSSLLPPPLSFLLPSLAPFLAPFFLSPPPPFFPSFFPPSLPSLLPSSSLLPFQCSCAWAKHHVRSNVFHLLDTHGHHGSTQVSHTLRLCFIHLAIYFVIPCPPPSQSPHSCLSFPSLFIALLFLPPPPVSPLLPPPSPC